MLTLNVTGDKITRTDKTPFLSAGSKEFTPCVFTFTDDWDGAVKTAEFHREDGAFQTLLDDNSCTVPEGAILSTGTLRIGACGVFPDGRRISSSLSDIPVRPGAYCTEHLPEPEQSVYAEILQKTGQSAEQAAEAAIHAAQAHTEAEKAALTAGEANDAADNAKVTAERAKTVADNAEMKAQESLTKSTNAVTTADKAKQLSQDAAVQSASAVQTATAASGTANAIASTAGDAKQIAEDASATAANVQLKIDSLETTVNQIQNRVNEFTPAYGVRFGGSSNTGETVKRLYNAAGCVAGVGTDTQTAVNDFDNIYPWSARRRCCGYFDSAGNFVVNAYQSEPGYTTDGSNGEAWVEHSLFFYKHTYDGDAEEIVISPAQLPGCMPAPIFVKRDGSLKQKAYTAAYPMATINGKATSRSGVFSDIHTLNTAMAAARTLGADYTVTTTAEWYTECLYMWVEFATRNLQAVMMGACKMPYVATDTAAAAEAKVNRIVVPAPIADKYVAGQTIGIGTTTGNANIANNRIVTAVESYDIQSKAIMFDGTPVNITVGNAIWALAWVNGSCDGVLSSSGSLMSNTSGKYNCIYRGKEAPYGNAFEWIADVLFKMQGAGTTESPYNYDIYYLPDSTKYANGAIIHDYIKLNYHLPGVDGYIKKLGLDSRYPYLRLPSAVGAATVSYYSDYIFTPRQDICAGGVGGAWSYSDITGPCCWGCYSAPAQTGIDRRARLSHA